MGKQKQWCGSRWSKVGDTKVKKRSRRSTNTRGGEIHLGDGETEEIVRRVGRDWDVAGWSAGRKERRGAAPYGNRVSRSFGEGGCTIFGAGRLEGVLDVGCKVMC